MFDFSDLNILVIGDCMLDQYIHGSVDRISPEAPVPVLAEESREVKLGGGANVACNLTALGAGVSLVGVTGMDKYQQTMTDLLEAHNISASLVADESRPTTVKTRLLAEQQQVLRLDKESTVDINDKVLMSVLQAIESEMLKKKVDIIILQDYNKGLLNTTSIPQIINLATKHSIKVGVDPKFEHVGCYKDVSFIKPNLNEALAMLNVTRDAFFKDMHGYASQILKDHNLETIWITLGEQGVCAYHRDGTFIHSPTLINEVVDVCGAGDAVISILATLQSQGYALKTIAEAANIVGGIVCAKPGVATVSLEELNAYFHTAI